MNAISLERRRTRVRPTGVLVSIFLAIWFVLSVGPLVWTWMNGLRTTSEIFSQPIGAPSLDNVGNYALAWETARLGQALLISVIIAVASVVLGLVCSLLAGFALSRCRLPFSRTLTTFFLVGLLIPTFALLLPILLIFQPLGLISNPLGLILLQAGFHISLGVFLFKNAFDSIPNEYFEAAMIDGASVPRILFSIAFPGVKAMVATFSILAFLGAYNDYVFALVLNNDPLLRTLPVALLAFNGEYGGTSFDLVFAAVTITTIPPLIAYLVLRRQVLTSMATGAGAS